MLGFGALLHGLWVICAFWSFLLVCLFETLFWVLFGGFLLFVCISCLGLTCRRVGVSVDLLVLCQDYLSRICLFLVTLYYSIACCGVCGF